MKATRSSADPAVRAGLLMPVCALAVHQARYYLTFGPHSSSRLARDGHSYLSSVEPFIVLACAVAFGVFLGRLVRAWQAPAQAMHLPRPARHVTFARVWAACTLALIAFYCAQELAESALMAGHPAGLAGVLGHGGWLALPLAAAIGAALAVLVRAGELLIVLAARRTTRRTWPARPERSAARRRDVCAGGDWRLDPACGVTAGRAPPTSPVFA